MRKKSWAKENHIIAPFLLLYANKNNDMNELNRKWFCGIELSMWMWVFSLPPIWLVSAAFFLFLRVVVVLIKNGCYCCCSFFFLSLSLDIINLYSFRLLWNDQPLLLVMPALHQQDNVRYKSFIYIYRIQISKHRIPVFFFSLLFFFGLVQA